MRRIITQCLRGCRELPHVGSHPGTPIVVFMVGAFSVMGFFEKGPAFGVLVMVVSMAVMLPPYLWGAYDRAEISDRCKARGQQP